MALFPGQLNAPLLSVCGLLLGGRLTTFWPSDVIFLLERVEEELLYVTRRIKSAYTLNGRNTQRLKGTFISKTETVQSSQTFWR